MIPHSMQNLSRPQPLTLTHVHRPEETWSSDSDSGITVDSHSQSPPSKTTPDSSALGSADPPSWNLLPPPPPSLLSDDGPSSMSSRAGTSRAGSLPEESESAEQQRQRQQEYVRSTLLEYERRKRLEEEGEEEGGGGKFCRRDRQDLERSRRSPSTPFLPNQVTDVLHHPPGSHHHHHHQHNDPTSPNAANDYVPCQMARKLLQDDVREEGHALHVTYHDLSEGFSSGECFPPGDDGYGTDSRSHTTGSLASPLSSSLSSLTTDSSGSLNGSQRGVGAPGGSGSVRAQPVAGAGRLVIGKRGMLVKRRDLPPVERTDTVTLEDRLRALTTIQEEDSAAASGTAAKLTPSSGGQRREGILKADSLARSDPAGQDAGSRSRSGSGSVSAEGQTYPEGLYSVITKRPNQLHVAGSSRTASRPRAEPGGDGGDFSSGKTVHRAVPVTQQPQGDPLPPQGTSHSADLAPRSDGERRNGSESAARPGNNEGRAEVRFKAGGGGVKLNESGQFEIDYSYYMKASPSDSNDDVNTYSQISTHTQFGEAFREGDSMPPRRRGTPRSPKTNIPAEDAGDPVCSDFNQDLDLSEEASNAEVQSRFPEGTSSHRHDVNYAAETEHVYMNVGHYEGRPVQGSMPNLSIHPPHHPRPHSGDLLHPPEPPRHVEEGGASQSNPRRNPTPGSGYSPSSSSNSPSSRLATHGDRNSCDVGSLYRQADLSHTFPPPSQGVAADRLSLNLGDLPRIHEQLRATSEMLLSSGKRHQFASSSDIYRLFQGQQGHGGGFAQGRQPPHRRSFHDLNASTHSLAEVRSRVKATTSPSGSSRSGGADQPQSATSPAFSPRVSHAPGPMRANHDICVPDNVAHSRYGRGRDHVSIRAPRHAHGRDVASASASAAPPGRGRDGGSLKDRLDRGQKFATDVILGEDGEQLSTLV